MQFRLGKCVVLLAGALLVLGVLGPASAASSPDWSGHWAITLVCTLPKCTSTGSGFIDLVQNGTALTGTATDPSTGEVVSVATGSAAAGRSATIILDVPDAVYNVYTFQVTMSADGKTFSGPASLHDDTSGQTVAYGTITGTRGGFAIKGKITEISGCGSGTCTSKPLAGATLTASGSGGGTATSAKDGTYAIAVGRGDYTVTPSLTGRPFTPASRKVTVTTADVTGVDFKTCAVSDAPSALSATAVQCARPTKIDWEMPVRTTKEEIDSVEGGTNLGLPEASWVNPVKWTAKLFTRAGANQFDCGSDTRFIWTVKPANLLAGGQPKVACTTELHVKKLGPYIVSAQMQQHSDGAWRDVGKPLTGKVVVKDWLVVGMGDSNGSGEGNRPFYYPRCNRSIASYQAQTALALEERDPHTSVTFLHTSCSGARVEHLWHTPYPGTRSGSPAVLPPQISQVTGLLREHGTAPERKVDVALVSIGVNDLSFGPVLDYCVWLGLKGLGFVRGKPCQDTDVIGHPEAGTINGIEDYTYTAHGNSRVSEPLREQVETRQNALVGRFDDLARVLPQIGVPSNHVFMAQYPDFSHGADGKLCGYDGIARMPTSTWGWLSQQSATLDQKVHIGARQHGWIVPEWDKARFLRAGYCAPGDVSLIRTVLTSKLSFDSAGPFHPNAEGHEIEYAGTIASVCRKLYDGDASCK